MTAQPTKILFCLAVFFVAGLDITWAEKQRESHPANIGSIQRKDPAFDKLVPPDAKVEVIARGFGWAEGPVWVKRGGYLVFSDVERGHLNYWKEGFGAKPFLNPSEGSRPDKMSSFSADGVTTDASGHLILCGHKDRRITRIETNLALTTMIEEYDGKRLNSPNDLIYKSNGDLYFTDPPYGLKGKNTSPDKQLPFNGVYRLAPDGKLTLLIKDLTWPNGIAFSPDEKTLYVSCSDPQRAVWMAYDVKNDGTVGKGRVFFDATRLPGEKYGLPNGMTVDKQGNIFATGLGGVMVFSPEGKHLGTIVFRDYVTNCTWGDDGSTLYITVHNMLCRIRTSTKGVGF